MGQRALFILRDPQMGAEGPEALCSSLTILLGPLLYSGLNLMFLLYASIPLGTPSSFWGYPDPDTAGGSPVTNFPVSGALELGTQ